MNFFGGLGACGVVKGRAVHQIHSVHRVHQVHPGSFSWPRRPAPV